MVSAESSSSAAVPSDASLPVIDLYTLTEKNKELLSEDGVHFTTEGYEMISEEIISFIDKNC